MILYYDCFSGICGDLNLGAMVDIGVDFNYLLKELKKLNLENYEIKSVKDNRKGITGTRIDVIITRHEHVHRHLHDINKIIESSTLSENVKKISKDIFLKIAQAEAPVHNKRINEVHFHEVGAIDSIIDIVGAAICLDFLKPTKVVCSTVELGGGFVNCAHGKLPVPAPATVEILKNIPVKSGAVPFETTTPTGAAILAAIVDEFTDNINFKINKIAYGVGQRDTEIPNVLRVYLGEEIESDQKKISSNELMIECNIDDMNPEFYDFVFDKLFENGALDVYITPIIMKKSRPANKLNVICLQNHVDKLKEIIFENTSTIGLREYKIKKTMLTRNSEIIETKYGKVSVKIAYFNDKKISIKPEYNDCKQLAIEHGVSIKEIYNSLQSIINN